MQIDRRQVTFGLVATSISVPLLSEANVNPVNYELNPYTKSLTVNGSQYHDPGVPYTGHTFTLRASRNIPQVDYAIWRVLWTAPVIQPPALEVAILRLFTRTPNTSAPKVPIAYLNSSSMSNPGVNAASNDAVDIKSKVNDFINSGQDGHFGWDIAGDNSSEITIYNSILEIGWNNI